MSFSSTAANGTVSLGALLVGSDLSETGNQPYGKSD